jgi:PAS domain S-box-containing protein
MITYLNSLLYIGAALVLLTVYAFAQLPTRTNRAFSIATACMAIWSLAYYVELTGSFEARVFAVRFKYGFTMLMVAALLQLTQLATGRPAWLRGKFWWLVWGPAIFALLLAWTASWHTGFRNNYQLEARQGFDLLVFDRGAFDLPLIIWFNLLALLNLSLLLVASLTTRGALRRKSALMLTALGIPGINNALQFVGVELIPGVNISPWLFMVTGPALFFAAVDLQALDLVAMAHRRIFDLSDKAYVVINEQRQLLDHNDGYFELAGVSPRDVSGAALLALPEPMRQRLIVLQEGVEHAVPMMVTGRTRYFDVVTEILRDADQQVKAWLQVWTDVTQQVEEIEERRLVRQEERLLRDLHDGVGGLMARIAVVAEGAAQQASDADEEVLWRIAGLAREGTAEVRALMNSAERRQLTWPDLVAEVRRYGELLFDPERAVFTCEISGEPSAGAIPLASGLSLYRVCREAMHNIARHAQADRIQLRIAFAAEEAVWELSDNGEGLPDPVVPGRGLGNMRRRMEELDGQFEVLSENGVTVRLRVPLPLKDVMQDEE